MIAGAVPETFRPVVNNRQRRPGGYEESDKYDAGDDKGRRLRDAETAIIMLLPIIMMVQREQGSKIEAKEKGAHRREETTRPLHCAAPGIRGEPCHRWH
jgi:hypothetical protein